MDERSVAIAEQTKGFMPRPEGLALHAAGLIGGKRGPLLEIGSYCGKSSVYLGSAARDCGVALYSIDHHRGSEEHQRGEGFHDPDLYDENLGRIDTLPDFLATIRDAELQGVVTPLIGASAEIATRWSLPLGLVFIDGGHSERAAQADFAGWSDKLVPGGVLVIHDVFEDPRDGGRPPFDIFRRAIDTGRFVERSECGSLRVLARVVDRV